MKPTPGNGVSSGGLISNDEVKKLQEMGFKTAVIYKAADIAHREDKNILDVVIQLQSASKHSRRATSHCLLLSTFQRQRR